MRGLNEFFHEFIGLFVEDGSFALSLLVWVGAAHALTWVPLGRGWDGLIFLLGCLLILIENVRRTARRERS